MEKAEKEAQEARQAVKTQQQAVDQAQNELNLVQASQEEKQKNYDYTLKLHDACGSQSLFLQCHGNNCDINELCDVINNYLKNDYIKVFPGSINPYNIIIK